MKMIAIVCHGDLDGLVSAALLLDIFRDSPTTMRTTQPYLLHNSLATLGYVDQLYILDIAVDVGSWNRVVFYLSRLIEKGCKVFWIDHHISTLDKIKWLLDMKVSIAITIEYCTSTIIREVFCNNTSNPDFFMKLSYIGEIGDKIIKNNRDLLELADTIELSLMTSIGDEEFKQRLVRLWIHEYKFVNDEVIERAKLGRVELERVLKLINNNVIFSSELADLVDLRGIKARGYIGKAASIRADITGKMVFIIHEVSPREVIFTARAPSESNMDVLTILRSSLSGIGGVGGGHSKAASYRLSKALAEFAVSRLQNVLRKPFTRELV